MSYNFNDRTKRTALNFYNMYKEETSMKKKKALSLVMAAVLALGVVPGASVWAEEQEIVSDDVEVNGFLASTDSTDSMEEGFVSDDTYGDEEYDFEDEQIEVETDEDGLTDEAVEFSESGKSSDIPQGTFNDNRRSYTTNIVAYNKVYNFSELKESNGYWLDFTFPEKGRIKIIISDCRTQYLCDGFDVYYDQDNGYGFMEYSSGEYRYVNKNIEDVDSGWFSVKGVHTIVRIPPTVKELNTEANIMIQYQKSNEYNGEVEDNDNFDTATLIKNNTVYDGDYSTSNDVDYYKFTLEQAGLVDVKIAKVDFTLYSEDSNGNVAELFKGKENGDVYESRIRLPKGNYFLLVTPRFYAERRNYTISVNVQYESADDYEQEFNNVKSQANEKKTNYWYTGNLNDGSDVDYYKMVISERSFLALEFKNPRQTCNKHFKITLYDENLQNKILEAINTENPYLKTEEAICPAGTYYVRVESYYYYAPYIDYSVNLNQRPYKYVTAITLPTTKTVTEGESFTLIPEITPSDAEDPSVTWSSNNPYVATVDEKGNVTAKAVGTTDIVVTAADRGTVSATCTLTVQERVIKYVTEIGIAGEKSVKQGTAFSVAPVITPGDAENKALRWQSSNPAVVEVDSNGNMMANRCGTARITVTAQDRDMVSASCVVTVYNTVRYNLNGGTNNGGNPSTFYGNTTNLLNPTRRGYTFSGWYSDKGFKKKVTQITSGNVGNTTFYAKWKKVSVRKTTITSFANKSGKKALVKYKAVSGASGYEIVYSTDKKVKKNRTTVKTKAKSRTLKGLKKGKTYYVKVRAYKTDSTGLVVYGKYSAIKKVKIKK